MSPRSEILFQKQQTFDEPCLIFISAVNNKGKTLHLQTIAMSLFEAMAACREKYGDIEFDGLRGWGSRSLPGKDGCALYGGGDFVPGKYDAEFPEAVKAIRPYG